MKVNLNEEFEKMIREYIEENLSIVVNEVDDSWDYPPKIRISLKLNDNEVSYDWFRLTKGCTHEDS